MASKAVSIPKNRVLPSKEAALFKTLLEQYESRQHKKALKTADQILKKFPEHGETTSMKGLVFTHTGRKEEGIELARKGVKLDLTSHICWHVFGLIHKADRNYEEALKCYVQALRFDKDNGNILRDAANLQSQLRHFDALQESRLILFRQRPNVRLNWLSLAVAYHLNGNRQNAKKVLEHYEATVKNVPDYDFEYSEVLLYHIQILEEQGEYAEALALIDADSKAGQILDKNGRFLGRARCLQKLGRTEEAEQVWKTLIDRNPECYDYYRGLLSNHGISLDEITDENRDQALRIFREISDHLPQAVAPVRLSLTISSGDEFRTLVQPYLLRGLFNGIPSLFADLKALYTDPIKKQVVQDLVEGFREKLEKNEPIEGTTVEPPTTYLWILYFLSQHYSTSPSTHPLALTLIDKAIAHTPTLPELYMTKARTLKRAGDPMGAAKYLEYARKLDLQDRFLNTKSAKYMFRAGLVEPANTLLGLFTKKDAPSPGSDLEEMQSLLYLLEEADAWNRAGRFGLALKKYHALFKTFRDIEDDELDFHGYCLRKSTLRAYVDMLKFGDRLRTHPAYKSAVLSAVNIYIQLHDDPTLVARSRAVTTEEEKRAKKKANKAAKKEEPKKANSSTADDKPENTPPKDEDPDGSKLLGVSDPLEQAVKLLRPLEDLRSKDVDVWIMVYDVAIRRKKHLQALRALNFARAINPNHPSLHVRVVDLRQNVSSLPQPLPSQANPLVTTLLETFIPSDVSVEQFNSTYLQQNANSPKAVLAVAQCTLRIRDKDAGKEEAEGLIFQLLREEMKTDFKSALDAYLFLQNVIQSSRTEEFRIACNTRYPISTEFKTPAENAALQRAVLDNTDGDPRNDVDEMGS